MIKSTAVKEVEQALSDLHFGEYEPALKHYRKAATGVIRDQAKRVEAHVRKLKNPKGVALLILLEAVGNDLASGRLHAGRGNLNKVGTALLPAFGHIVRQLGESGTINLDEAVTALKTLEDEVAKAG